MVMRDIFGKKLTLGEWFLQPIRTNSNTPEMGVGQVIELNEEEGWFRAKVAHKWCDKWVLHNQKFQGKKTKLDNLVVLGQMMDYINEDDYYAIWDVFDPTEDDDV